MSDVLSPEEVDALLQGVSSGDVASGEGFGVPAGEVLALDLTDPNTFSRDQIPPLEFSNQVLARHLTASVRPLLNNIAEVTATEPRLLSYADYLAELAHPTFIHQTHVLPLDSDMLFVLSTDLILNYVDFYYGGDGVHEDQEVLTRDFTVTERGVAGRLQQKAERFMTEAWAGAAALTFEGGAVETNPAFSNFFSPSDMLVASRFEVAMPEKPLGWIDILLPKAAIDPYRRNLEAASQGDPSQKQSRWANAFESQLQQTEVELSSTLSTTTVNLGELVKLRIGDILPFELPPTVELTAGDVPLFRGTFGVSNGRNAIRITERLGSAQ